MYAVSSFVCNDDGTTETKTRLVFEQLMDAVKEFDDEFKLYNAEYGGALELILNWRDARDGHSTCVFGNSDYVLFLTIKPINILCKD